MTSFQEFLRKKADEQHSHLRRERRDEWIVAVSALLDRIDVWLHESDPDRLLDIIPIRLDKAEAGLGTYEIYGLKIAVGDLAIQVLPVARNVVGSPRIFGDGADLGGRVDITDGTRKYIVMRVVKDGKKSWEVLDDQFGAAPLDRARLEAIIQDLLA